MKIWALLLGIVAIVGVAVASAAVLTRESELPVGTIDPVVAQPALCEATNDGPSPLLVPACGAWIGSSDRRTDELDASVQETLLGRQLDMVRLYIVGPDADVFTPVHRQLADEGRTLVYSWKVSTDNSAGPAWRRVADGEFDDQLVRIAEQIVDSGHTVLFSLHHEPEDDATTLNGNFGSDADYANMMRHAHEVMEPIGGDQMIWFVNYMGHSFGDFKQVEAMYPGDDVIDWVSWNPYNWFGCHGNAPWKGFREQAKPFYDWAQQRHPDKPLMIGETATNEDPDDPLRKANWIADMGTALQNDFPQVRAVLWFHQSTDSGFCERRWDSSDISVESFSELANSAYFNPAGYVVGDDGSS